MARLAPPLGISYRYFLLYILHIGLTRLGTDERCGGFRRSAHAVDPDDDEVFANILDVFAKFLDDACAE